MPPSTVLRLVAGPLQPLDDLPAAQPLAVEFADPAEQTLLGLVLHELHAVVGQVVAERDLVADALPTVALVGT